MISPDGLSVPAPLDAAAAEDREAAVFPALAALERRVAELGRDVRPADELAAGSGTEAPRMSRPAAQAESA